MIHTVETAIAHGMACALVAFTYSVLMRNNDTPLSPWFDLLAKLHPWIAKPLGDCAFCFAGQLALWSTCFGVAWPTTFNSGVYLMTCIGSAVFLAYSFMAWYRWSESNL